MGPRLIVLIISNNDCHLQFPNRNKCKGSKWRIHGRHGDRKRTDFYNPGFLDVAARCSGVVFCWISMLNEAITDALFRLNHSYREPVPDFTGTRQTIINGGRRRQVEVEYRRKSPIQVVNKLNRTSVSSFLFTCEYFAWSGAQSDSEEQRELSQHGALSAQTECVSLENHYIILQTTSPHPCSCETCHIRLSHTFVHTECKWGQRWRRGWVQCRWDLWQHTHQVCSACGLGQCRRHMCPTVLLALGKGLRTLKTG